MDMVSSHRHRSVVGVVEGILILLTGDCGEQPIKRNNGRKNVRIFFMVHLWR
jgi:hypothetical protein